MSRHSAKDRDYREDILKYLREQRGDVTYAKIINAIFDEKRPRERSHEETLLLVDRALESLVEEGQIEKNWLKTRKTPHTWGGPKMVFYRIKK